MNKAVFLKRGFGALLIILAAIALYAIPQMILSRKKERLHLHVLVLKSRNC